MWPLPTPDAGFRVHLPPGRYLLPWYWGEAERERAIALLERGLDGIRWALRLRMEALPLGAGREMASGRATLVVVEIRGHLVAPPDPTAEPLASALRGVHARHLFIHAPTPAPAGYGWVEQHLKPPVASAVARDVRDPDHPLAPLGLAALPVGLATGLTDDPVELLEILDGAVAHRLRYLARLDGAVAHRVLGPDHGTRPEDWRRSVVVCAGQRLAARLRRLAEERLPLAVEVLLAEIDGRHGRRDARWLDGARALQDIGLARLSGRSLALGALARQAAEPAIRGSLLAGLPAGGWTDRARVHARQLLGEPPAGTAEQLRLGLFDASSAPGPTHGAVEDPNSVEGLVATLGDLQPTIAELPTALAARVVPRIRALEVPARADDRAAFEVAALQVSAAAGPDILDSQRRWLIAAEAMVERGAAPPDDPLVIAARYRHAWSLLERPRDAADVDRAQELLRALIAALPERSQHARGSAYLLVKLARLHARPLGEPPPIDRMIEASEAAGDLKAAALGLLVRARMQELASDEDGAVETLHRGLELADALAERRLQARIWRHLARLAYRRGDGEAARASFRDALEASRGAHDQRGIALAAHGQAGVLIDSGEWTTASARLDEAERAARAWGDPVQTAVVLATRGDSAHRRGVLGEAEARYREARDRFEAAGSLAMVATSDWSLAVLALERGDPDEALAVAEQARAAFEVLGHRPGRIAGLHLLAHVLDELGGEEEATLCALQAVALELEGGDPSPETVALVEELRAEVPDRAFGALLGSALGPEFGPARWADTVDWARP